MEKGESYEHFQPLAEQTLLLTNPSWLIYPYIRNEYRHDGHPSLQTDNQAMLPAQPLY